MDTIKQTLFISILFLNSLHTAQRNPRAWEAAAETIGKQAVKSFGQTTRQTAGRHLGGTLARSARSNAARPTPWFNLGGANNGSIVARNTQAFAPQIAAYSTQSRRIDPNGMTFSKAWSSTKNWFASWMTQEDNTTQQHSTSQEEEPQQETEEEKQQRLRESFTPPSDIRIIEHCLERMGKRLLFPKESKRSEEIYDMYYEAVENFDLPEDFMVILSKEMRFESSSGSINCIHRVNLREESEYFFTFEHDEEYVSREWDVFTINHELGHAESYYGKEKNKNKALYIYLNKMSSLNKVAQTNFKSSLLKALSRTALIVSAYHTRKEEIYADKRAVEEMTCYRCCFEASQKMIDIEHYDTSESATPSNPRFEKESLPLTAIRLLSGRPHPENTVRAHALHKKALKLSRSNSLCEYHAHHNVNLPPSQDQNLVELIIAAMLIEEIGKLINIAPLYEGEKE